MELPRPILDLKNLYLDDTLINVILRVCHIGKKEKDDKCILCQSETYSFQPKDGACLPCSSNAVYYGGNLIVPRMPIGGLVIRLIPYLDVPIKMLA
jgi:hypothetical protein